MSSNTNLSYKRAVRILTGACGLLFSAFSFIYLYLFQGDVFVVSGKDSLFAFGGSHYHYTCLINIQMGDKWLVGVERFGKVTFIFPFLSIVGSADGCEPFSLSWWKLCG